MRLLLRWLRPARLAELTVALLCVGFSLVVGGLGRWGLVAGRRSLAGDRSSLALVTFVVRRRRRLTQSQHGAAHARRCWTVSLLLGGGLSVGLAGGLSRSGARSPPVRGCSPRWRAPLLLGLLPLAAAGLLDLRRSVEWFIAVRYLVARRRQVFISAITAICVAGIAAGVWLIIVVLSVMNGFERTWREEILGNRAHFTVQSASGPLLGLPGAARSGARRRGRDGRLALPRRRRHGSRSEGGRIHSVRVRGIDPATVGDVTELPRTSSSGRCRRSADQRQRCRRPATPQMVDSENRDEPIVIGNQLAMSLGVGLGDRLLLISPYGGAITPLGPAPRLKRFEVAGVFETSFFQYDEVYTYVSLPAAQDFRHLGDVIDGIEARTTDFYRSRSQSGEKCRTSLDYPFYHARLEGLLPRLLPGAQDRTRR